MRCFIDRKMQQDIKFRLVPSHTFSARDAELPEDFIEYVTKYQEAGDIISDYLELIYELPSKTKVKGLYPEIPTVLKELIDGASTVPKATKETSSRGKRGVRKQVRAGGSGDSTEAGD